MRLRLCGKEVRDGIKEIEWEEEKQVCGKKTGTVSQRQFYSLPKIPMDQRICEMYI